MTKRPDQTSRVPRSLRERVCVVLDTIRPLAQSDGGDLQFVDIDEEGVVRIRLSGACVGCPSSAITLTLGLERSLKERIPEVTRVICEQP